MSTAAAYLWSDEGRAEIGERVEFARRDLLGLSLKGLGAAIGVSHTTVINVEAGNFKHVPTDFLDKLAHLIEAKGNVTKDAAMEWLLLQVDELEVRFTLRPRPRLVVENTGDEALAQDPDVSSADPELDTGGKLGVAA